MKRLPWTVFVAEALWWGFFICGPLVLITHDLTTETTALISAAWLLWTWMHLVAPHIVLTRHVILPKIGKFPLKIALISDLHAGPYKKRRFFSRIVKKINAEMPDVVLIPGDFLLGKAKKFAKELLPLAKLEAPTFCTLGNHDHWLHEKGGIETGAKFLRSVLRDIGVVELNNESVDFFGEIKIAGVDDNHFGYDDLDKALKGCDLSRTVLMAHSPDIDDKLTERRPALTVCGHTHGGQVNLPMWIGHLPSALHVVRREFAWGWFRHEKMFVTMGVGESGSRVRWWAWPEVVILNCSE